MSKVIAVWGSPESGKTTLTTQLAAVIYEIYSCTVVVVYTDMETPSLPVLFPTLKAKELHSAGGILTNPEITSEIILQNMVVCKERKNMGYLGFCDGENEHSYPRFGKEKAGKLLESIKEIADYILVDCTSSLRNPLAEAAVVSADTVLRLATPDLMALSYYSSQMPLYADPAYRLRQHIQGLTMKQAAMPLEEARQYFQNTSFVLPFAPELQRRLAEGSLIKKAGDKKYCAKLRAIAKNIVEG